MTHSRSLSHHRVTLSDGTQFDVAPGQTLLQAALSAGLEWPNGCRVGLCGSCRCKITSGQVKALTDFSDVISQADLTQGHVLACRCQLESAIDVSSDELYGRLAPDDADIDATITHIDWVTPLVQLIEVELDHPHPHGYAGGQYTRLEVPGVVPPRCFSFANACRGDGRLRFLVRVFPGGRLGEWLSQEDRCGQRLRVGRPLGHFLFRDHHRPALFFRRRNRACPDPGNAGGTRKPTGSAASTGSGRVRRSRPTASLSPSLSRTHCQSLGHWHIHRFRQRVVKGAQAKQLERSAWPFLRAPCSIDRWIRKRRHLSMWPPWSCRCDEVLPGQTRLRSYTYLGRPVFTVDQLTPLSMRYG